MKVALGDFHRQPCACHMLATVVIHTLQHNQGGANQSIFYLPKFSKTFSVVRYSIKLQSLCALPRKYELDAVE